MYPFHILQPAPSRYNTSSLKHILSTFTSTLTVLWGNIYLDRSWFTQSILARFEVKFDNPIHELQLWLVIKVCYRYHCDDFLSKYNCRVTILIWIPWIHGSRKCWGSYRSRDHHQQGDWSLTIIPVCCLTWSSSILSHMLYSPVFRLCTK